MKNPIIVNSFYSLLPLSLSLSLSLSLFLSNVSPSLSLLPLSLLLSSRVFPDFILHEFPPLSLLDIVFLAFIIFGHTDHVFCFCVR